MEIQYFRSHLEILRSCSIFPLSSTHPNERYLLSFLHTPSTHLSYTPQLCAIYPADCQTRLSTFYSSAPTSHLVTGRSILFDIPRDPCKGLKYNHTPRSLSFFLYPIFPSFTGILSPSLDGRKK